MAFAYENSRETVWGLFPGTTNEKNNISNRNKHTRSNPQPTQWSLGLVDVGPFALHLTQWVWKNMHK